MRRNEVGPTLSVTDLLAGTVPRGDLPRADSADPVHRWAAAVALGGLGHYAAAAAYLERLMRDRRTPVHLRAHTSITRGSHLRQQGGHDAAAVLDGHALRLVLPGATGPDAEDPWGLGPAAAVADALTGLAADALGRWDAATASVLLARARPWCERPGHRVRVRYGWVCAETALVAGDRDGALRASAAALDDARELGSARHVLKSRLVRAVAAGVAGAPEAPAELDAVAEGARRTGHRPLNRAARAAAADLGRTREPSARRSEQALQPNGPC